MSSQSAKLVSGRADVEAGAPIQDDYHDDERVVLRGEFQQGAIIKYYMWSVALTMIATIVGIPFLILLPCIRYMIKSSVHSMELTVTDRSIIYRQGVFACFCCCWNTETKHIPLDKIQDLTFRQGCLERSLGISSIAVQTAGQTAQGGPELMLRGVVDPHAFRRVVNQAKARYQGADSAGAGAGAGAGVGTKHSAKTANVATEEVHSTLLRIEAGINRLTAVMEAKV